MPVPAAAQTGSAIVFVSTGAGADGDGSRRRPFATLQQALAQAPSGALVRLEPGTYEGPFVVRKPVVLAGAGAEKTRLVSSKGGGAPVIATDGNALELRGLAVEGAAIGIAAERTSLRLSDVVVQGQSEVGLSAVGCEVDVARGAVLEIEGGTAGKGLLCQGGTLRVQETVFRKAGRRAIELHRTSASLLNIDAAGSAVSALQALERSDVSIQGGTFRDMGGPALFGSGSTIRASKVRVSRAEYGLLMYRQGRLALVDAQISDTLVAGAAFVHSDGEVTRSTIQRGGSEAAVAVSGTADMVKLEGNRIENPGSMGLHASTATIVATDNVFTGATLDGQGDLGDAIFAVESNLTLLRNRFEGNAGSGTTLIRSQAHLVGNRFAANVRGGLVLLDRSTAKAQANEFTGNPGPGVLVADSSHAMVARNRFADSGPTEVEAPCDGGGEVDLRGNNDFLGPAAPRARCP
jgi:hypothetical protein